MFDIEYKGANTVVIATKKSKLITDPKLSIVGLKDADTKDAIELSTETRFSVNNPDSKLVIEGPGEYGIAGFDIKGIAAIRHIDTEKEGKKTTIYRLEVEGARIGVLGNIADKLSEEQLESLGVIDILILPVGGNGYTLDATSAVSLVRTIEPSIVIPIHYQDERLKYEVPQCQLSLFISELGAPVEKMQKYKYKNQASGSVSAALTVIELERS
jgi:hypothetical protein